MQIIDKIFQMEGGYVLDFSDRAMTQFFAEELNIDIDHPRYRDEGTSKAKRLRCFLRKEDTNHAVRTLNALWEYRETRRTLTGQGEWMPNAHAQLLNLLNRLQGKPPPSAAPPPPSFEKPADYAGLLGKLMVLSSLDPQPRGYAFEDFLKQVFSAFGLLPRGGFRTTGEQIDGSFVLAGETYLLEAKWQNAQTPAADLHAFQGKLRARVNWARGLFVSYSGFSQDGLTAYGRGGSVICMDGLDLHDALQREIPLNHVLEHKVRRSVETGEVFARVRDL
ncbi:MAG: restriction endonuclease [Acetobacteraceae bacterium]